MAALRLAMPPRYVGRFSDRVDPFRRGENSTVSTGGWPFVPPGPAVRVNELSRESGLPGNQGAVRRTGYWAGTGWTGRTCGTHDDFRWANK